MASQSVTTSKNRYTLTLTVVENSTSTEKNTSNISVTLTLKANGSYIQGNKMWGDILVDGVTKKRYNEMYSLSGYYASLELASYTGDVSHNADGTKTVTVSATLDSTDGAYPNPGSATVSLALTLSTIPRKSEIGGVSLSGGAIEQGFSVSFSPASSSFSHRVEVLADGSTITARDAYSAGAAIVLTAAELLDLYRKKTKTVTVRLITTSGGSEIGRAETTVTLAALGNAHVKTGGEWKRGMVCVGTSPGVVMIRHNGEWRAAK